MGELFDCKGGGTLNSGLLPDDMVKTIAKTLKCLPPHCVVVAPISDGGQ